jgi:hypothetical protein
MLNPTLADLVGGIQTVTLGDEEARRRGTQKSILERKAPPTFDVVVEIQSGERVAVHGDVAETVDAMLRGYSMPAEVRELGPDDEVRVIQLPPPIAAGAYGRPDRGSWDRPSYGRGTRGIEAGGEPAAGAPFRRVYPFGVSRKRLEQAIRETGARVAIAEEIGEADAVMTLRSYFRRKPQALRDAEARGLPIYVLKTNTVVQMEQGLLTMQQRPPSNNGHEDVGAAPVNYAMQETEDAITGMLNGADRSVELTPQNAYIRRLQHEMAHRYTLGSQSQGREPYRRVRIYREGP